MPKRCLSSVVGGEVVGAGWMRTPLLHNLELADALRALAEEWSYTPAQLALAWLLHKGGDIVPIPGTKRRKYLEENVAAADVPLDPADMTALDDALSPSRISGARYNETRMANIDR